MDETTARTLLEAERARLLVVRDDLDGGRDGDGDESARAPVHAADVATDVFEREKDQTILHRVDAELREVDDALRRLARGRYGTCATCGTALPTERLEAVPAARYCTRHEAMWEGDRLELAVPAGRYEDGDAHTTDRAAAREAGRHLELVGDDDQAEPLDVAPEDRALHLTDPGEPNPTALSAEQVAEIEGRQAGWADAEQRAGERHAEDETEEER